MWMGRLKSVLGKIRTSELCQLSFYVLSKCFALWWFSLCSKPYTRLLCCTSNLYSALAWGINRGYNSLHLRECQVYSEVLYPLKEALPSHLVQVPLLEVKRGEAAEDTPLQATFSLSIFIMDIDIFKKRWKHSLPQKLPLFAFLATFPSLLWSWNKFFPPPAPPFPSLLLSAVPVPETETTNDTSTLPIDRGGWASPRLPHPMPQGPPPWEVHPVLTRVRSFPTGRVDQNSLDQVALATPWSLKRTKVGNCRPALEPKQPPKASGSNTSCIIPSLLVSHSLSPLFCC